MKTLPLALVLAALACLPAAGCLPGHPAAQGIPGRTEPSQPTGPAVAGVQPDPGTLHGFRDQVGKTFTFEVTGSDAGTVYGTDVYTDDSELATATVHAGVLKKGQKGTVKVTLLAGQEKYPASTRHGVESRPWDKWDSSYRVEAR
jgi:LCCL domain